MEPQTYTPEFLYLLAGDAPGLAEATASLRSADIAELLSELPPGAAARVVEALPLDVAVQLFDEPELEHRHEIFVHLSEDTAVPIVEAMSADQQAELFRSLEEEEQQRLLPRLSPATRSALGLLLRYPPETAGGIMTTEFVSVPASWTVEETLRHLIRVGRTKETVYAIYVVDAAGRFVHVVSLRELLGADRRLPVLQVGDRRKPVAVAPLVDREEVARLIGKYNLLAIPVIDERQRILGIVTVDDVIDALVDETTEDVQKFGGMEALDEPYLETGLFRMIRKRAGWLCALFLGELLTATAMRHYEAEIARAVVLTLFIPLIISSGGNSGSQATTLVIRAMTLGEIRLRDWPRVIRRELAAGLVLGSILGALGFLRILIGHHFGDAYGEYYLRVALTVAISLVGVVLWGSITGSMLPIALRRLGLDPASASAPLVATLVDVTGLVIYFTLASLVLGGTLL